MHLDVKSGGYFDYGKHTEKVGVAFPLNLSLLTRHDDFDFKIIVEGSVEMV